MRFPIVVTACFWCVAGIFLLLGARVGYLFDQLPPLIQDDSVRVAGKGSAGVTILGLEVQRIFLERSRAERVQALDAEIRTL